MDAEPAIQLLVDKPATGCPRQRSGDQLLGRDFASMRQRDDAIDHLTRLKTSDVAKSAQAMKRGQFAAAAKLTAAATAAANLRTCIQSHAVYNKGVVAACRR
jgi:hypothetical protein